MTPDPRAALARLVAALEDHLAAAANRRGEADPVVSDAYQRAADAFEVYEEAIYDAYDEVTPFVLYEEDDDDDDDDDDDADDDDDDADDDADKEPADDGDEEGGGAGNDLDDHVPSDDAL
ncbi:MAG: hypothetical protein ACRYF3_17600 [Janthinobacterium lividum]